MSNNDIAIRVENLSKKFTLQHAVKDGYGNDTHGHWALKDVSFEIKKGESVGIIGPNGSGKSTLLKILAGVTKPTTGKVEIYGRVASILDIGAGFHPELSGRENVFLNGQLLGFSKKEIQSKFEEIVDFSGIEKFINEPVKNYSNGMYLRLAFSIMAHLDFDLYLFDEVLAVGDQNFKLSSAKKIESLYNEGKTVLYVSHNIQELYKMDKYINLEYGILKKIDRNNKMLNEYIEKSFVEDIKNNDTKILSGFGEITSHKMFKQSNDLEVKKIKFFQNGNKGDLVLTNLPIEVEIEIYKKKDIETIELISSLSDLNNNIVFMTSPFVNLGFEESSLKGNYVYKLTIPANILYSQRYFFNLFFFKNCIYFFKKHDQINSENLTKNNSIEIALSIPKIITFKTKFIVQNKEVDFQKINLYTNLFMGLKWRKESK